MKGIVVSTDNTFEIKDFGEPLYKTVGDVVGGDIELIHPKRLGSPLNIIVNGEGLLMKLPINNVGCFLYQTDLHGHPIVGDFVIMKDGFTYGEPEIVGLDFYEIQALRLLLTVNFDLKEKQNV